MASKLDLGLSVEVGILKGEKTVFLCLAPGGVELPTIWSGDAKPPVPAPKLVTGDAGVVRLTSRLPAPGILTSWTPDASDHKVCRVALWPSERAFELMLIIGSRSSLSVRLGVVGVVIGYMGFIGLFWANEFPRGWGSTTT